MEPVKARIFRNGANQAIRIPVDMSFDAGEVTLERDGDALRVRPLRAARIRAHSVGSLKVSTVTQCELEHGARRSERSNDLLTVIESFLANVEILPFDFAAARQAAIVRARLAGAGRLIGQYDTLIAGHALALGATLVTKNVEEFRRVGGLAVENWAD